MEKLDSSEPENRACMELETSSDTKPTAPTRAKKRQVVELGIAEVRWFYRKLGSETKWNPFKGFDSLRLEILWRSRNEIETDPLSQKLVESMQITDSCVVLEYLYEVSEEMNLIRPLYWKGDEMDIIRGTWFSAESMQPIDSMMADRIDQHHLSIFRHQTIPEMAVFSDKETTKKPVLTELKVEENYVVRWNSVIDVILHKHSKTNRILRYITWSKDEALKRGYEEAEWSDGNYEIGHLILVVHGIGLKGYEGLVAKNTDHVRDEVYAAMDKFYAKQQRPIVLPVEWREALVLDNGYTDHITLPKMFTMRNALNSTALDIMYFQSALYRNEMMSGLLNTLNAVFDKFKRTSPGFDGSISIFAHSLGSVMCYDLITNWSPVLHYEKLFNTEIERRINTDSADCEVLRLYQHARQKVLNSFGDFNSILVNENNRLSFKISNLFCIGSPLAVFLVMRGESLNTFDYESSSQFRVYNIFHPCDPVAYRLEPLVYPLYRLIRPIKLFPSTDHRSSEDYDLIKPEICKSYARKMRTKEVKEKKKNEETLVDAREKEQEDVEDEDGCDTGESYSSPRSPSPVISLDQSDSRKYWWKFGSKKRDEENTKSDVEVKLTEIEEIIVEIPTSSRLSHRLDYQLPSQVTDIGYLSFIKSHSSYWTNTDLASFVVNRLFQKSTYSCGKDVKG